MSEIETRSDILTRYRARVSELDEQIDTLEGEFVSDVVLQPLSEEIWRAKILNDYAQKIQSLSGFSYIINSDLYKENLRQALYKHADTGLEWTSQEISNKISTDLDRLALNWGVPREGSEKSVGSVAFFFNTSANVTIPIGTRVWTDEGVYFTTTQGINQSPNWSAAYSKYRINISIEAENAGVLGNVFANKIKNASGVASMHSVRNLNATTGGEDAESDATFIERLQVAWRGRNLFTRAGLKRFFESFSSVKEAFVVMPGDTLMERKVTGAVDVYVIARVSEAQSELLTYYNEPRLIPSFQPVIEAAESTVWPPGTPPDGPGGVSFIEGVDFEFVEDTGAYRGSVRERSYFEILPGKEPASGSTFRMDYTSNGIIRQLWDELEIDEMEISGDLALKEGVYRPIYISWKVTLYPGYTTELSTIQNEISTIVSAYFVGSSAYGFSHKGFGDSIDQSDLVGAVYSNVPEVDTIEIPLTHFYIKGQASGAYSTITLSENEYTRLGSITFL